MSAARSIEVERKFRVPANSFKAIATRLLEKSFSEFPTRQQDTYLFAPDKSITRRVRRERRPDSVVYFLTDKRKLAIGANTNDENEREISQAEYRKRIKKDKLVFFRRTLVVYKKRLHFFGTFDGRRLTVCLDHVTGPRGLRLGHFVELETMVSDPAEVKGAQQFLKDMAKKLLPDSRKREHRGYRTMLLDRLSRGKRRIRKKHFVR